MEETPQIAEETTEEPATLSEETAKIPGTEVDASGSDATLEIPPDERDKGLGGEISGGGCTCTFVL